MAKKFEVTEYYELVALHRALHASRFARDPLIPSLTGSPYLAEMAKRIVETLVDMEIERGKPERTKDWQIKIDENGEIWKIAVKNAANEPELWNRQTHHQKIELAHIFLSPFLFTDQMVANFIHEVDDLSKK